LHNYLSTPNIVYMKDSLFGQHQARPFNGETQPDSQPNINRENPEPVSPVYSVTRAQLEHLNTNLNQRITYLIIAQSFFFSGYAILTAGKVQDAMNDSIYKTLLVVIPLTSLLTVIFTLVDALASFSYMRSLREHYENTPKTKEAVEMYPPIHGTLRQRVFEHVSPIGLPIVFLVVWIILSLRVMDAMKHPSPPPPPPQQQQQSQQQQPQQQSQQQPPPQPQQQQPKQ